MRDHGNAFARAVRVALATRGWTQADLATAIGVAPSSVCRAIAIGRDGPTAAKIRAELGLGDHYEEEATT